MNHIDFDNLNKLHACCVNLGCLQPVAKHFDYLCQEWSGEHDRAVTFGPAMNPLGLADAVDVVAKSIVFDTLVIDSKAEQLNHFQLGIYALNETDLTMLPWISTCAIPPEIYINTYHGIMKFLSVVESRSKYWARDEIFADTHAEKDMFEHTPVAMLANTGDGFGRTLFYIEVGRAAGIPVMFTPAKRELFANLTSMLETMIHDVISEVVDKELRGRLSTFLSSADSLRLPIPPLNEFLISHARQQGCSLLEAAAQIRATDEAIEYRSWLAKMYKLYRSTSLKDDIVFNNEIQKIQDASTAWLRRGDTGYKKRFTQRVVSLDAIPAIGSVLKLFGMEKMTIPDMLLTGDPKHLQFIASWYS